MAASKRSARSPRSRPPRVRRVRPAPAPRPREERPQVLHAGPRRKWVRPKSRTRQLQKSEATRQRLMEAGVEVFCRDGYAAASVQDIAARAKVTKPALYHHFQHKAGLYDAILRETFTWRLRTIEAATGADSEPWLERLEWMVQEMLDYAASNPARCRLGFQSAFAPQGEAATRLPLEQLAQVNFIALCQLMRQGVEARILDPRVRLEVHAAALHGHILFTILYSTWPKRPLHKVSSAREIVRHFLLGGARRKSADARQPQEPRE